MKLRTILITALGLLGTAASPALAQITYVSQSRTVYARGSCATETFTAPDFGPFNQGAFATCGSNVGTAGQGSTLGPSLIHLGHSAGAGGGAESSSDFNVVFDVATSVAYSLTASFPASFPGSGTLTGPGTSITFGAGGVTSSSGTLSPGRYTMFSRVSATAGKQELTVDLAVQGPPFSIDWSTIDSGGGELNGGAFAISGTAGQPDAASRASRLSGDTFQIIGGFWAVTLPECGSDFDGNGFVNADDFDAYVDEFIAGSDNADFDGNGFVNGDDFDAYVVAFESGC